MEALLLPSLGQDLLPLLVLKLSGEARLPEHTFCHKEGVAVRAEAHLEDGHPENRLSIKLHELVSEIDSFNSSARSFFAKLSWC